MANISDLIGKILAKIKCSVCSENMSNPIYLCEEGHSICQNCKQDGGLCGLCKAKGTSKRNHALEEVNNLLVVMQACPYNVRGCRVKIKLPFLEEHKKRCQYSTIRKCPFCEVSLEYSISLEGTGENLLKHLLVDHGKNYLLVNRKYIFDLKDQLHHGVRFLRYDFDVFYVRSFDRNDSIALSVEFVGPKDKAKEYTYTFSVFSGVNRNKIQTTHSCTSDLHNAAIGSRDYISIPTDIIKGYVRPMFSIEIHHNKRLDL